MKNERHSAAASAIQQDAQDQAGAVVWPNLFIVGAVKAGTTSLHTYLSQHPHIFMSRVKEPHFFSDNVPPGHRVFDESSYLALFSSSLEPIRGESSPLYLWDASTPQRIRSVSPDAKIIVMLRNPIQRAFSHYLMDVERGWQQRPFLEAVRRELDRPVHLYVELGRYCHQVSRYLNVFDGNVLVIFFEEFFGDVRMQLKNVFRFLGVATKYADSMDLGVHNAYAGPANLFGKPHTACIGTV